jgi:hypothetical protein
LLAAELGEGQLPVDDNLIGKWERGDRTPSRYYAPRLCLVFESLPEQIGLVATPRLEADLARLRLQLVKRREFLSRSAALGGAMLGGSMAYSMHVVPRSARATSDHGGDLDQAGRHTSLSVDGRVLDALALLTARYTEQYHRTPPSAVLHGMTSHVMHLMALVTAPQPPQVRRRLHSTAGEALVLAGWLAFRLGDRAQAAAYWARAEALATDVDNGGLRALALVSRSNLYSGTWGGRHHGDAATAIALLDAAETAAGPTILPILRAWLQARRAEERAVDAVDGRGDRRQPLRDLERADRSLSAARDRGEGFLGVWDEAQLVGYRGSCSQILGRDDACGLLEAAFSATDATLVSQRSAILANIGAACAQRGEIDRACAALIASLDVAVQSGLRITIQRIAGIRGSSLAHTKDPAVRQLDDRLVHALAWI